MASAAASDKDALASARPKEAQRGSVRHRASAFRSGRGANAFARPEVASPTPAARHRCRRLLCGPVPQSFPWRKQVNLAMRDSPAGMAWDFTQTLLSLLSCAAFVASGYGALRSPELDVALTIIFTVDYGLRWYASPSRLAYPTGLFPIVDVLTCVPVYIEMAVGDTDVALGFFRFVRVVRVLRVLRLFKALNANLGALQRQLVALVLTVISMIFLMAGLLTVLEEDLWEWQMGSPTPPPEDEARRINSFGNAIYYLTVTLATVGYGDLVPLTPLGRAAAALFIPLCIVLIPIQVNELTSLLATQSKYSYTYKPAPLTPHILIAGHVRNEVALRELLHEIYHSDRLAGASEAQSNRVTLIMSPEEPTDGIRELMVHHMLDERLKFILGNPKDEADLVRAAASKADACFLLSDVATSNKDASDRHTAFRAVLLRTHAPQLPVYIHGLTSESVRCLDPDDTNLTVMAADEVRAKLVARGAMLPGFSTLVCNLMRGRVAPPEHLTDLPLWQQEYAHGTGVDPVAGPVPASLDGLSFSSVAQLVYAATGGEVQAIGVQELDAVRGSPVANARLAIIEARIRHGGLSAEDLVKAQSVLGAGGGASGDALVPGQVLLNPGREYKVRAGQMLFLLSHRSLSAAAVFDDMTYEGMMLPPPLSSLGRDLEDGYGFPDSFSTAALEDMRMRVSKEDARLAQLAQMAGNVHPMSAIQAAASAGKAVVRGEDADDDADSITGVDARRASFATPSIGPASSASTLLFTVPLGDLHRRQAELLRLLEVQDVRNMPNPPEDHVIVVCRLSDAPRVIAPIRNSFGADGVAATPPWVVLLTRPDEEAVHAAGAGATTASAALHRVTSDAVAGLESLVLGGRVSMVLGSVDDMESLARAGVSTASSLIMVSRRGTTTSIDGERVDNDVVFGYRSVMRAVRMMPTRPYFYAVVELLSCTDIGMLEIGTVAGTVAHPAGGSSVAASAGRSSTPSDTASAASPVSVVRGGNGRSGSGKISLRHITGLDLGASVKSNIGGSGAGHNDAGQHGGHSPSVGDSPSRSPRGARNRGGGAPGRQGSDRQRGGSSPKATGSGSSSPRAVSPPAPTLASRLGSLVAAGGFADGSKRASATANLRRALETHMSWVFLSPLYAAGFAMPADCIHTLLVAAFYMPSVMPLFNALLSPWPDGASRLMLEYVPTSYNGKTYGEMAEDVLLQHGAVVVGLYRGRKAALAHAMAVAMEAISLEAQPAGSRGSRDEVGPGGASLKHQPSAFNLAAAQSRLKQRQSFTDLSAALQPAGGAVGGTAAPSLQRHAAPFSYVLTHPPRDTRLLSTEDDGDMVYILSRQPVFGQEGFREGAKQRPRSFTGKPSMSSSAGETEGDGAAGPHSRGSISGGVGALAGKAGLKPDEPQRPTAQTAAAFARPVAVRLAASATAASAPAERLPAREASSPEAAAEGVSADAVEVALAPPFSAFAHQP